MFLEVLVAISCLFIQPTIHHFIGDFDECTASKVCNHTWSPVCGHHKVESEYRLFLDDCDLHEYNCDNNTTYVEVDTKVCSTKCTQRDHTHKGPMPPTIPSPQVSTIMSTEETKTETSKITRAKEVTETTTVKADTSTMFVAPTTLEVTTEEIKNTRKSSEMTTKATTVNPVIVTLTATDSSLKYDESNNNDDANEIVDETTQSITVATAPKDKLDCHPKRCSLPSTWETTHAGETRDFVQILRERYGDRIKILRDTTHFPKLPMYVRKSEAFLPGYHMEGQSRLLF